MMKKVFAFDLDGTLTEHRTWITDENLLMLDALKEHDVRIIVSGAGQIRRFFTQMRKYPAEIIGCYGLQYAVYREELGDIEFIRDLSLPCDKKSIKERVDEIRKKYGYENYFGSTAEFHPSGCVTFPLLGTKATTAEKMSFDQGRTKRREMLAYISETFSEYNVFIAGSNSFDLVPKPYNKYYALDLFCKDEGYDHSEIIYFGDDYSDGGNDEIVLKSDIDFVKVGKHTNLTELVKKYIK